MDFFNVLTVDEANKKIIEKFSNFKFDIENIDLLDATGRILAENIISDINVPEFNRSTVDGYSIIVEDSHGSTDSIPSILNLMGEVRMGTKANRDIVSGEAIYTPTGGMVPPSATGVIMIENTELMDKDTLLIYKPISKGENLTFKGDDIKAGDIVLKKGRKINSEVMGVLASLGIRNVSVFKKPRFYIISTGDEIISLDEELTMGKVRDINTFALYSMIQELDYEVVGKSLVKDDYDLLAREVQKASEIADIILISGGSSVGTRDFTHRVINSIGEVFIHGLAIKPGKPTIVGKGNDRLIVGLPGHPVSSIVVFKAIIEKFLNEKLGLCSIKPQIRAITEFNFPSSPGKETYHMVTLSQEGDTFYASPTFGKSGMITLLSKSQGYIVIKGREEGINKGEERTVYLL